jgi:O-antigen/teichoic acid export membrane protein
VELTNIPERANNKFKGWMLGDALRARAMRGGAWLGIGSIAEQGMRFGRNMILARLLAPGAFGTMAIVISSAFLVDAFIDVGVRIAIIQNPEGGEDAHLNAAWWLGLARALVSYLIIFALAPWIGTFYGRPELCPLLRVALLSVILNGLMSPRSALAQREMKLGRWAMITNGGAICGVLFTILLSFVLGDVWALAIGYCSENAFRLLLSFILCPGWPSIKLDWAATRQLLNFSKGMFGLAILNLIINRADIFVLGRMYPMTALGLYTMAVSLVATPSSFLSNLLAQTLLPAFSSIQQDMQRLNKILMEVTAWLLLGMPLAVFLSLTAPTLLRIAYGQRYVSASAPLSVAAAVVFVTVLNVIPSCVLFAKGLPSLHRHAVIATAATMAIAVYPASKLLGPVGAQYAALAASVVGYVFQLIVLRGATDLDLLGYGAAFLVPTAGSILMLAIVLLSRHFAFASKPITDICVCVGSCLVAYAVCALGNFRSWRRRNGLFDTTPESTVTP